MTRLQAPSPLPVADDLVEVAVLDRAGTILAVNAAWERFCLSNGGDPAACGPGADYLAACAADPDDEGARQVAAAITAAVAGGLPAPARVHLECSSPVEERWYDVLVASRFDDDGRCVGATVTLARTAPHGGPAAAGWPDRRAVVAAPRTTHEARLRASEAWFRSAFERAPSGMVVVRVTPGGRRVVVRANQAFATMLGETVEALAGADLAQFTDVDDEALDRAAAVRIAAGGSREFVRRKRYRRRDGSTIWVDIRSAAVEASALGVDADVTLLGHVTDVTHEQEELQRRTGEAVLARRLADVGAALLAGGRAQDVYPRLAAAAAEVTGSPHAVVVLARDGTGAPVRVAAFGPVAGRLQEQGVRFSERLWAAVHHGGEAVSLAAPPPGSDPAWAVWFGPLAAAPFVTGGGGRGLLAVARDPGGPPYAAPQTELLTRLSTSVALMIETAQARDAQDRLALLEDRHRIARDLHDTVIQDLIAIGMQVGAALRGPAAASPAVVERLLAQLDEAVAALRGVVFTLGETADGQDVDGVVRRVVAGATRVLGHQPVVRLGGPLDRVPATLRAELAAVLREALSNIARHAGATSSAVTLTADPAGDGVRLVVEDDGAGVPAEVTAGNGLTNMAERARRLGGRVVVRPADGGGTRVEWAVPLRGGGAPA